MKIICLQENLKKVLNIASNIIGKNLLLPILNNILIEVSGGKIKIFSTNLEMGISAVVSGKIEKEGKITVPAKTLTSFVNNLPNKKIELEVKKNILKISSETFKAEINGLTAEEFPIIPRATQKNFLILDNIKLKEAMASIAGMTSISDSRPEITGVLFSGDKSGIRLVATDSFRLAEKTIIKTEGTANISQIIPQRTVQELIKILGDNPGDKIKITFENNQVFFETGDIQLVSRLIDGSYPDYKQIIPGDTEIIVKLDKDQLISSVRLASVFGSKINEVKLSFNLKKKKLVILAADPDLGTNESELEIDVEKANKKEALEVSFNYRYLLDGLSNLVGKKVVFGFNGETSPGIMRSSVDGSYLYLIMPIKAV